MSVSTKVLHRLDVRGEICPYPLTITKKQMQELQPGEQLEVLLDYPLSVETIPRWAETSGHQVLGVEKQGDAEWRILLEKGRHPLAR
jgi:tRNA 2-thiouridine synthesizing protein A